MAATFFYLVRNEAALRTVTAEVRSKFSHVEDIVQGAALSSCTYLRACIDEAMRMSPSVGGIVPREVLPGGITIDGHTIPEGTVVGVPHYAIHHNPAYFPRPFEYVPERWITGARNPLKRSGIVATLSKDGEASAAEETTKDDVARSQSAFCPFSIGPRGCIGKGLAYVEMTTTLARTIFLYDMRRAVGVVDPGEGGPELEWGRHRKEEFQLYDTFTSAKKGPVVEFRRAES